MSIDARPNLIMYAIIAFALLLMLTVILIPVGVLMVGVTIVLWVTQKAKPQRTIEDILRVANTEFSF